MADVQLENGYFKIANELFEQLFIRDFSILQLKILLLVVRCSYGFHKKVAKIKPQRLFELAYIYRCDVKEELKYLRQNRVIVCNFELGEISLNKNYDEWKIPYHKLFKEDDLAKLKKINLEAKQIAKDFEYPDEVTPENVCGEQTNVFVHNKQDEVNVCPEQTEAFVENKQNEKDVCLQQTEVFADNKQISTPKNECLPTANNVVCGEQTDVFVHNKQVQAENVNNESVSGSHKYNEIIEKYNNKDIYINNSSSKPKLDPFVNPIQQEFKKQYKNILKRDCYLNNNQMQKLLEISIEVPNFKELIPNLLTKFSKITFTFNGVKKKVGLRWLLEDGNWAGILSGEFDQNIESEGQQEGENDGYTY